MKRSVRVSQPRWRTLGSAALAAAAVAMIGFTTVTPARADADDWRAHRESREHRDREEWRERREWREERPREGVYLNFGTPQPGVYYYDRY
jgi:predicted aconitase